MKKTINGLLVMQKHLQDRKRQLTELVGKNSRRSFWEDRDKKEEPVYDITILDVMVTNINLALLKIEDTIKESNARTEAEVDIDFDDLMKPIPESGKA